MGHDDRAVPGSRRCTQIRAQRYLQGPMPGPSAKTPRARVPTPRLGETLQTPVVAMTWGPRGQEPREGTSHRSQAGGRLKRETQVPSLGRAKASQPTPVFLPGESHGQRSLVGYSPWGCRVGHN